ncbi:MAG: substrate-binding domain-containing protein, partial [Caldilineaceae bacterium]|nr:substrate-binding domain-containing protein [Caldilineaceae bacterium]
DLNAHQLLTYCAENELQVPGDLAIVGFDGIPQPIQPRRALTTVRAPWADVAAKAVETLLALLNGVPVEPEYRFPIELVVGDTT